MMLRRQALAIGSVLLSAITLGGWTLFKRKGDSPLLLSARDDGDGKHYAVGYRLDGTRGDQFFLLCANPVMSDQVDSIRTRLEPLHTMTVEELKAAYKQALGSETPSNSKGAGLGFLTMAREASEPLEFEFVPSANEPNTTIFCIKAII